MKQALMLVGAVALTGCLAAVAQKEVEFIHTRAAPWLFGSRQEVPVTAPTGEFPTNPALGAR